MNSKIQAQFREMILRIGMKKQEDQSYNAKIIQMQLRNW
ncbi:unnamed protein product [Paramecium sonneborni]|uniref:Uncharacterized protein n=1 Tax=Paramecium sonneborni TaxID=65129 RepID=A0A8S1R643_9CILI|nr:unnamed protein product [Paramecium sonneborni]